LHTPRVARPAPSERASSPFESLIEDTPQPAAEPAPPRPESKVAKTDDKQAPAKTKDCNAADPNDDTKPENADEGSPPDAAALDGRTLKIDCKKIAKPEIASDVSGTTQTKTDSEPEAGQKTDDANTASATDIVTPTSPDAISIVQTPAQTPDKAPVDGNQDEPSAQQLTLVADAVPKLRQLVEDLPKAAAGKKAENVRSKQADAGDQVEADQPAAEPDDAFQILTKDATPRRTDDKPETELGAGDKQHVPQVRSDVVGDNHRADASGPTLVGGGDIGGATKVSADTTAQVSIPGTTTHSTANAAPTAPTLQLNPQPAAVPLSGVAIEIAGRAIAGKNRFEIRLDPPELGRIEVRLDVDRDGNVTSRLTVDRPETLDLLRRDAPGLERALQDAGLKTANNGLQFSLRDQSMNGQQTGTSPEAAVLVANDESLPSIGVIPQQYRLAGQGGGLDIRV
jgi:flagellar hook-length control protein FliK